jgi:hypothetical protein
MNRVDGSEAVRDLEALRDSLRDYNHADVIWALGLGDLLESIGCDELMDYIQSVGFGPATAERRKVRQRVVALAASFECLEAE